MLAAHRNGGRTTFAAFAHAWDRLAYRDTGKRSRRARRATERELLILRTQLEASLSSDDGPAPDLAQAPPPPRTRAHRDERDDSTRSTESARRSDNLWL